MQSEKVVNMLGLPVGIYNISSLVDRMEALIAAPDCAVGVGLTAHTFNLTYHDPKFFQALRKVELLYADGASLIWASRLLGYHLPEKVATADAWPKLCKKAVQRGYRFFLLGGEPGLAERAASQAQDKYPGLDIVGTHHGYFDLGDERVVATINAARPDVLWVGMGDPRQVLWIANWRHRLDVRLILTCGGMFKIVAGQLDRISLKWRQRGFEWAYRFWQEPATWRRYILGIPLFGMRILGQALFKKERLPIPEQKSSSGP